MSYRQRLGVGERWGGGGWFDPPFVRPDLPSDFAELVHFHAGAGYSSAVGWTGGEAESVEVEDADGLTMHPIESPLGVIVVVAEAGRHAAVRVRSGDGRVLLAQDFSLPSGRWL